MSDSKCRGPRELIDIIDKLWKNDKLPFEDIAVPHKELPDLEPDSNGHNTETLAEQEQKWTDLALQLLDKNISNSTTTST